MQRRLFTFAGRIAVACAFMGTVGCATILKGSSAPVSISSTPSSADVEIKRVDGGIVVEQGQTPMTVKLGKGKEYTVTISLDGYQTKTVPILKGGIETAAFCNLGGIVGWAVDYSTGAMYKLEPSTINVQLKEVTAQDGNDTAIYAFLTIVDEDGTPQYAAVEMTPVAAN